MSLRPMNELPARDMRKPPFQDNRVKNSVLDTSIDLYHDDKERIPVLAEEMIGVHHAADRLTIIDLNTGERTFLPSRSEITKNFAASKARHHTWYRGIAATQSAIADYATNPGASIKLGNHSCTVGVTSAAHRSFKAYQNFFNHGTSSKFSEGWTKGSSPKFAMAYAGNGYFKSRSGDAVSVGFFQSKSGSTAGGEQSYNKSLNFDTAHLLYEIDDADAGSLDGNRVSDNTYKDSRSDMSVASYAYRVLTPSAYEYFVTNCAGIADLPKVLKELGYAFERIYKSDRTTFDARIQDAVTMRLGLGLTELAHTLRTRRFSKNARSDFVDSSSGIEQMTITYKGVEDIPVTGGVVNEFFHYLSGSKNGTNADLIIAPWWLADALDSFTFWDKDTDLEMRDIERMDVMDGFNRLLEAASKEQGMNFGSHSRIPMSVFDDYKNGTLPDFKEYTSVEATRSAMLLGYKTARSAYAMTPSNDIGRLPYLPSIVSSKGTILGKDKAEFMDRIAEASDQTIRVGSSTEFTAGQQLVSPFSYKTIVMRTRFGEASMDTNIIPMMFQRITERPVPVLAEDGESLEDLLVPGVVTFGTEHWLALDKNASSMGYLPLGMNGSYYLADTNEVVCYAGQTSNVDEHNLLWEANYWRPGRDNYLYLMMDSLECVYREWDDAADRIRTEGVESPTFAAISLMSEFSYATPSALWAANFGKLRRMLTIVSDSASTAANIDGSSTFFDAMALGNNYHGASIWEGKTLLSLENRFLLDSDLHERDGELNLAPGVLFLGSSASDSQETNFTAMYQLRSALMAHTSLLSEPILDAYTACYPDFGATHPSDNGAMRHSGYGSNRIVYYEGDKDVFGTVRDLLVTPIAGYAGCGYDFKASGDPISVYPIGTSLVGANLETIQVSPGNEYQMFLFSPSRIRAGSSVQLRSDAAALTDLTEDDFIPGLHYDKIWFAGPLVTGATMPQTTMAGFSQAVGHTVDSALAAQDHGVHYLKTATSKDANYDEPNDSAVFRIKYFDKEGQTLAANEADRDALADLYAHNYNRTFRWWQGATLSANGLTAWKKKNAEFIELVRSSKEYQAFNPVYTVLDLDFNDAGEAMLNASLCMLGLGTTGPITYVGAMNADGSAGPTTTLTGEPVFQVISLTMGAGATVEDDVDVDSDDYEENPDLEPKVVTEEVVN